MASSVKISGSYKDTAPYVKVAGNWKFSKEAWAKVSGSWKQFFLAGGLNDSNFNIEDFYSGFGGRVWPVAIQSDGKILVGGDFSTFNGATANRIIRLNADGTRDTAFTTNTGTGPNGGGVYSIAIQSDGKILLGGEFRTFNGLFAKGVIRLNANGTRDTVFSNNGPEGVDTFGGVESIAIQSDGKILLGGWFTTFNTATANGVIRLNANGTRDTAFMTNVGTGGNSDVTSIAIQPDGKILLTGYFSTFNGLIANGVIRLNADGTRDTAFMTNVGTGDSGGSSESIAIQSDGKIVVGGWFTTFNGATANGIVRLNANGTLDTAFTTNTGTGVERAPSSIAIQPDGKILLGGYFRTFNGATAEKIARLNANGTLDTAFATNTGMGAAGFWQANVSGDVLSIAIQSDGKILVGGDFFTFNEKPENYIVRLNVDGTRDTTTFPVIRGLDNFVNSIAIQPDGKILVGGSFSTFNGATANRIIRLNADGTRDTAFTTNTGTGANGGVYSIAIQSDGKILLGGEFTTFNGATVNYIVRLNADGTRDTAFTTNTGTGANGGVYSIAIQPDGKILVGGSFSTFNGATANRIIRLNADGTRDTAFMTNVGTGGNSTIRPIAIQPDGKILLGGEFTTFNGATVNYIVRLNADGTRDTAFTTNTGTGANGGSVRSIAIQPDGKILVGGGFSTFNGATARSLIRLNANGTRDTVFMTNNGTGLGLNSSVVFSIAIQSDGKLLVVGGNMPTFNGTTINGIVRLNANGTRDTAFTTNTGTGVGAFGGSVFSIALQPAGKILLGGGFTVFNGFARHRLARLGGDLAA